MAKNKSIVYIDDDETNLLVFSLTFNKDFEIQTFISAIKALNHLKNNIVDLVITDQKMPEMLGTEFLEIFANAVPENRPKTAVISGFHQNEEITASLQNNYADAYIPRPWEYETLKLSLTELLND